MFWLIAAGLVVAALVLVVPPMLRRPRSDAAGGGDADTRAQWNVQVLRERLAALRAQHAAGTLGDAELAQAESELEREVLAQTAHTDTPRSAAAALPAAVLVAVAVPALAFGLYLWLGSPGATSSNMSEAEAEARQRQQSTEQLVGRLAARLHADPSDGNGWALLGRTYAAIGRYQDAVAAFANALERLDREPALLLDYAEARALAGERGFDETGIALVEEALARQPDNPKGLWMRGMAAYGQGRFADAMSAWERLSGLLPAGAPEREQVAQALAMARDQGAGQAAGRSPADATASAAAIDVTVSIDPALAARVDADDVLFVYARAPQGPRVPLAVARERVGDLPRTFRLDDSMAMMPQRALSSAERVVLVARISRSGEATPADGDLFGETGPVSTAATSSAELVIDSEIGAGRQTAQAPAVATASAARIDVTVSIDPALAARVNPDDMLFVYARAPQGPRMPLAVARERVGDLPRTFRLDDSTAMMPQRSLSSADQVILVARISRSGSATPADGDLFGETGPVNTATTSSAELVIDSEVSGG